MKTRQSVNRRFRITKNGKVLRGSSYTSHLHSKKSKNRKRRLKSKIVVRGYLARKVKMVLGGKNES